MKIVYQCGLTRRANRKGVVTGKLYQFLQCPISGHLRGQCRVTEVDERDAQMILGTQMGTCHFRPVMPSFAEKEEHDIGFPKVWDKFNRGQQRFNAPYMKVWGEALT